MMPDQVRWWHKTTVDNCGCDFAGNSMEGILAALDRTCHTWIYLPPIVLHSSHVTAVFTYDSGMCVCRPGHLSSVKMVSCYPKCPGLRDALVYVDRGAHDELFAR